MNLEELETLLLEICRRVEALEAPKQAAPASTLPRGKYAGSTHAHVVAKDPGYVDWNARQGFADGLGFTASQINHAKAVLDSANPPE